MISSILGVTILLSVTVTDGHVSQNKRPNVVVIIADDLGIGDLGCYGNDTINTPNIDRLASEGVRLTHHLAASALCTPSRAALLTGRYASRYGLTGAANSPPVIISVASTVALPPEEITLAKALSAVNYTTAAVGKWHLGAMCGWFGKDCNGPQIHGFQQFYGMPSSLIEEFRGPHPFWIFPKDQPFYQGLAAGWILGLITILSFASKLEWRIVTRLMICIFVTLLLTVVWFMRTHYAIHDAGWWRLSPWMNEHLNSILMLNDEVVEQPIVLDGLAQNLVNYSIRFIEDHAKDENPFFLYHSFGHVHAPMYTHPSMAGRSKHGRYGDNVEEMDAVVGLLMSAIEAQDLDDNTIIYFVSDHGGHLECVTEDGERIGGHNGLYKGGKGHGAFEGGIRVPGIFRWKGHIPSSLSIDVPTSLMDMMPTILELADLPHLDQLLSSLPPRELDGISIANLLLKETITAPRVFIHHCWQSIHALRWATADHVYKMFLKRQKFGPDNYQCGWGINNICSCIGDEIEDLWDHPLIYDLTRDPYEDHPISENTQEYKEVEKYLKQYLHEWQKRVPYPPSLFADKASNILLPWLQPVCLSC